MGYELPDSFSRYLSVKNSRVDRSTINPDGKINDYRFHFGGITEFGL